MVIKKEKRERKNRKKEEEKKQKLATKECKTKPIATCYPPNPQYIPDYEEESSILARGLLPRPAPENITSNSRQEDKKNEERRTMLELLDEEINLDYCSESDSDSEYGYQTFV